MPGRTGVGSIVPFIAATLAFMGTGMPTMTGGCSHGPKALPLTVTLVSSRDEALVHGVAEHPLVTIASATGIGTARIVKAGTAWPETLVLALHYADRRPFPRLESVRVEVGSCSWSTFLGSTDTVACSCNGVPTPTVAVIPVRQHEGSISVGLPTTALGAWGDTLTVHWVDVFRH